MRDKVFGMYDKCPECGKSKGLFYVIQCPLTFDIGLNGKEFMRINGRRTTKITQKYSSARYRAAKGEEFQVANCNCELCGWVSEPITA